MLILICGIPNSGKTTYSLKYDNVIHLDGLPEDKFKNCYIQANKVKGSVYIEGYFYRKKQRIKLINACRFQSPKICIWLKISLEKSINREMNYRQRSKKMIEKCYRIFEPPNFDEGWDEIIVIHEDGNKTIYKRGEVNGL